MALSDWFNEYRVSQDACNRILRRAGLPPAARVERVPRGEVNAVFEVVLADDRRVMLKVQIRPGRPVDHLVREQEMCRLLVCQSRLRVPEVLTVDSAQDLLPHNYSLLSHLPGVDAADVLSELAVEEQRSLFRALGQILAGIHAVPVRPVPAHSALPLSRSSCEWDGLQEHAFRVTMERHRAYGFLPEWQLREAEAAWARTASLRDVPRLSLLHGDFQPANIKVDPSCSAVLGVYDFDQADVGRPEHDLSALELWVAEDREDLREQFHDGYSEVLPLVSDFTERVRAYALLRGLQLILAYQGPVRWKLGGATPEMIARLAAGTG